MLEKIKGVLLKSSDYGETHKIVTIFSDKAGKISAIARGAKKPKSRMAALTQPFIYGEFLVYINQGLSTLQQGEIIQSHRHIREDIIKTAYAAYLCELTNKLIEEKEPDYLIWTEFMETLKWLDDGKDPDIPMMMYEMKVFQKAGFAPMVSHCVHCHSTNQPYSFSIREGGFLCPTCRGKDDSAIPLSNTVAKLLHILSKVRLEKVGNISVKDENKAFIRELMDAYYEEYGGFYLKSKRFLKQINQFPSLTKEE